MTNYCDIEFGGWPLKLDASGVLFWASEEMLIVSDLHLEKASFLARFGSPLPQYDTRDTLYRLEAAIKQYQPRQVVCLGDSFHDRNAYHRLQCEERSFLHAMVESVPRWHWILGNHDAVHPCELPGQCYPYLHVGGVTLAHEPEQADRIQIVGHFHPKARLSLGGSRVSGKCFMVAERLLIMPSFGSYTGGLDSEEPALGTLTNSPYRRFILYKNKIWKLPL